MKKKLLLKKSAVCAVLLFITCASYGKTTIAIQPMGVLDKWMVAAIRSGIEQVYNGEVVVLPVKKLPREAFYQPRKRYRAEKLLRFLEDVNDGKYTRIVGITGKDISTTKGDIKDWGIFGLGSINGPSCVISTFRLWRGKASRNKFKVRLVKVVNHEIGHTFGLYHCPSRGCLMQDARGTIKTVDSESGAFCKKCKKKLGSILKDK